MGKQRGKLRCSSQGNTHLAASAGGNAARTSASPPTLHQGPAQRGADGCSAGGRAPQETDPWPSSTHSRTPHTALELTTFGGHKDHLQPRGAPRLREARCRHGGDPPGAPGAPTGEGSTAATPGGGSGGGSGLLEWGAQLAHGTRLAFTNELER